MLVGIVDSSTETQKNFRKNTEHLLVNMELLNATAQGDNPSCPLFTQPCPRMLLQMKGSIHPRPSSESLGSDRMLYSYVDERVHQVNHVCFSGTPKAILRCELGLSNYDRSDKVESRRAAQRVKPFLPVNQPSASPKRHINGTRSSPHI